MEEKLVIGVCDKLELYDTKSFTHWNRAVEEIDQDLQLFDI